jgi:PAS domain S-box-containing protein
MATTELNVELKILFVEDQEEDYVLVNRALKKDQLDFEGCWVKDQDELTQQLEDFNPDLIISDYNLPSFSGKEALAIVKQKTPTLPFILISGAIGEEKAIEMLKMGATDFIMKDNLLRLPQAVRRAIKEAADKVNVANAQEALRESEQRLQMAIEGGGIGLWDWQVGQKIHFNQEFAKMTGYPVDKLENEAYNWEAYIHENDLPGIKSSLVKHLKSEFSFFRTEFRILTQSGKYKWIMAHGRVIERNEKGLATVMIGVYIDVHERKTYEKALKNAYDDLELKVVKRTKELRAEVEKRIETEKQLNKAKEMAESASSAKSEFLANMSHEIRSPLNAIVGFSQILISQAADDKKYPKSFKEQLEYIKTSGEALSEVINDILDISKIEEGKMTLSYENVELVGLIRGIYHINKGAAEKKNLIFNYSLSKSIPKYIRIDRTKLKQILVNLISNAIKYTADGKRVTIKVDFDEENKVLFFSVKDEGIGIPPDQLEDIFTRFKQVDSSISRDHGGTGLGLAITKRLVQLLKGDISVKSELMQGSEFVVSLPYLPTDNNGIDSNDISLKGHAFTKDNLVLIIEDNPLNVKMIQAVFNELEIKTVHCNNGMKGVRLAQKMVPDLILMDMHIPKMDGIETTKAILKNKESKEIPIVALSADAFEKTRKEAIEAGIVDYITKPLDFSKLLPILKRFLKEDKVAEKSKTTTEAMSSELQQQVIEELKALEDIPIFRTEVLIEKLNLIERFMLEFDTPYRQDLDALRREIYGGELKTMNQLIKKIESAGALAPTPATTLKTE